MFHDETEDAPGKPWVLADEEDGYFPDVLGRFETEAEAIAALEARQEKDN